MPKRLYKVNSTRSPRMLNVTWNSWIHILPGQMLQKREIKEKKGASHKLLRSRAPKCVWDDCIELEAYIRYNTYISLMETKISCKSSDISQFCKLEQFEWVMFWDETASFPDDMLKWGHYLGPGIDVGPAMTAKILTEKWTSVPWVNIQSIDPRWVIRQRWVRFPRTVHDHSLWKVGVLCHTTRVGGQRDRE